MAALTQPQHHQGATATSPKSVQRQQMDLGAAAQQVAAASPVKQAAAQHRPVQREASSLSIVFSASWVRLSAPIGEGAFSRVYEGVYRNPDTQEESVVAIKILKKSMLKRRSDCLRFIKEAKIVTRLHHRHIAACYGIGKYEDDDPNNPGSLFIVQELIRGGNLLHKVYKQMLNRAKCVYTSQEALQWMMDVAAGMAYLHSVKEGKPMIIHRDLKLENIMLAGTSHGTIAKLVDFGLHKVIDDRIKKVVKRVISEANLGTRLGRLRAQHEDASLDFNLDDELEAALAEQHAMVVASSVKPGVGPAALSPLGAGGSSGGGIPAVHHVSFENGAGSSSNGSQSTFPSASLPPGPLGAAGGTATPGRKVPGRGVSRLSVESSGLSMTATPEEADEEEQAIQAQAQDQQQQQASKGATGLGKSPLGAPPSGNVAEQGGATNGQQQDAPPGVVPAVAKIRAPVQKQSSMQKLMAKMKEIRLKVTGKDSSQTPEPSGHSGSNGHLSRGASVSQQAQVQASSASATTSSTPAEGGIASQRSVPQATPAPGQLTAAQQEEKRQRNLQLLDRAVAAHGAGEGGARSVTDQLGLVDSEAQSRGQGKARAPPRRAVTMISEIRYNLTEAVGSWAYMAPEVVLGQPYNEKVDVFSFGVILFEVLFRKLMLVDEIKNDPRKDAQNYAERVARGFRPEIPKHWPEELQELIAACWAQDPHQRPNFAAIVDALDELHKENAVSKLDLRLWGTARTNAFI